MPIPRYLYILSCKHVTLYRMLTDDIVYCPQCDEKRALIGVHVYEWVARCKGGCHFTRWTGLSAPLAEMHANNHIHSATVGYEVNPNAEREFKRLKGHGLLPQS